MADPPQDIQVRRFVRPIGVTGLGTTQPGRTARRMRTLSESFDGVLPTGPIADPATPPVELSYLTLAPLVARGLARADETAGAGATAGGESISSEADGESDATAPAGDELRVRDLLRDDDRGSAGERDVRPTDFTVSDAPRRTIDEDGEDDARSGRLTGSTDSSDDKSSLSGPGNAEWGHSGDSGAHGSDRPREGSVSDPTRTVVEQSAHGVDPAGAQADPSHPEYRHDSSPQEGFEPGRGSQRQAGDGPSDGVPTTVVHRGAPRRDEAGGGTEGQTSPAIDGEASSRSPGNGHGGPSLTVTGPEMTAVSAATDADSASRTNGSQRQSRPTGSHSDDSDKETVTERTVIRSDGRLNDRVFDRLYEELSRKMRLDREREGR